MNNGGINIHDILSYYFGTPITFQQKMAPYYNNFIMNNAIKGYLPEEYVSQIEKMQQKPSLLYELLGG